MNSREIIIRFSDFMQVAQGQGASLNHFLRICPDLNEEKVRNAFKDLATLLLNSNNFPIPCHNQK